MDFIVETIQAYSEAHTAQESDLLKKLNRETNLKVGQPRMLSGHLQGRILSFLSKLMQPEFIMEIGTYTGYSALCLAEGLKPSGKLLTIDPNEETNIFAKRYFESSPYSKQIELVKAQALDIIPKIEKAIDLVFIDADKKNYLNYYIAVIDKVRAGGLIIADNVLWSGKILEDVLKMDAETKLIHEFNEFVNKDERVENLLLPVRDGLMLLRKK
ncbi:MAG: O-methyltransferase [Bacteroidota bacterium]|nr:O-methyltransferase [Bacteroidota bacterium]